MSELILFADTWVSKGEYGLTPYDLSCPDRDYWHLPNMPDRPAIRVPEFFRRKRDVLAAQAEWLNDTFTKRTRVSLIFHLRARDDIHRGRPQPFLRPATTQHREIRLAALFRAATVAGSAWMRMHRSVNMSCARGSMRCAGWLAPGLRGECAADEFSMGTGVPADATMACGLLFRERAE